MAASEKSDRHLIHQPVRWVVKKAHGIVQKDYLISNKNVVIAQLMVRLRAAAG